MKPEERTHKATADYINLQYPGTMFNVDLSGIKLTKGQAVKAAKLRSGRGFPDIQIYEPKGGYRGLFIEVKAEGEKLIKKNGEWKNEHIREQANMIERLRQRGYAAYFAIGFDEAREILDSYFW